MIKKQLNEYRAMVKICAATLAEIRDLEEQKTALGGQLDDAGRVIVSPGQHARYEAIVEKLIELQKQAKAELEDLYQERKKILEIIRSLEDPEQRAVLHLRYISCLKWEVVAENMGYSTRQVHRIHKDALEVLEEKK